MFACVNLKVQYLLWKMGHNSWQGTAH